MLFHPISSHLPLSFPSTSDVSSAVVVLFTFFARCACDVLYIQVPILGRTLSNQFSNCNPPVCIFFAQYRCNTLLFSTSSMCVRDKHLQSLALALSEALRRVEEWEEAGSSTAGGNRNGVFRAWFSHRALSGELAPPVVHEFLKHVSSRAER